MEKMDFLSWTKKYYAQFLDVEPALLDSKGFFSQPSLQRDQRQPGYSQPFILYLYCSLAGANILSYSKSIESQIAPIIVDAGNKNMDEITGALANALSANPAHSFKFYYTDFPTEIDTNLARKLELADYADFLAFHKALYPQGNLEEWLEDYFIKIQKLGIYGLYQDGILVSATEAPDMPYLGDTIVEIGINTLEGYRKRGYATIVCAAMIKNILRTNKMPIWSCSSSNSASRRLAESLGFVKLADVHTATKPS